LITTTEIYTHIDRSMLRQQVNEHFPRQKKWTKTNNNPWKCHKSHKIKQKFGKSKK
jgi:hypothetical protein